MQLLWGILYVFMLTTIFIPDIATGNEGTSHFVHNCKQGQRLGSRCFRVSDGETQGYGRLSNCKKGVIRNEEENDLVKELMKDAGEYNIWIEREKGAGFDKFGYYDSDSGDCFYMGEDGEWSSSSYCRTRRKVLCTSRPECEEGWIGSLCNRQCHCYKEDCSRDQNRCKNGCEIGWTGYGCFQEVKPPNVEHYCVKNRTHYSLVLSLSSANGTTAGKLVSLDQDGMPVDSEKYTATFREDGLFEITTEDLDTPFEPNFREKKVTGSTFEWSFRLRQHDGLRFQSDADFRVMCDFLDIDVMEASTLLKFDIASFGKSSSSSPLPIKTDTKMILKDPVDENQLTNVSIGQPIKVVVRQHGEQMNNSVEDGQAKPFLFMSPRKCFVKSPDNVMVKQLTDERGCSLHDDYFGWYQGNDEVSSSEAFSAFGVPGYSSLNISCSLFPCFQLDRSCEKACHYWNG